MSYDDKNCALCYVKLMGSKASEKINICSKCLLMDLKQGKMKMINILKDKTFDKGFCDVCLDTASIVDMAICSEHGGYTV